MLFAPVAVLPATMTRMLILLIVTTAVFAFAAPPRAACHDHLGVDHSGVGHLGRGRLDVAFDS